MFLAMSMDVLLQLLTSVCVELVLAVGVALIVAPLHRAEARVASSSGAVAAD